MNINLNRIASLIFIMVSSLPITAFADYSLRPYFGADIGIKHVAFKSGYGNTLFKNKQPIGSIFLGVELCPHIDLGINVEKTISSNKKTASVGHGGRELGLIWDTNAGIGNTNFDSKFKLSSVGVDLFYKFNTTVYEKFRPLIGVGVKKVKAKLSTHFTDNTNPAIPTSGNIRLNDNKSKIVFKLSGGAEYMFSSNFGARILLSLENTSGLTPSDGIIVAKLKNSFGATIGAIIRI